MTVFTLGRLGFVLWGKREIEQGFPKWEFGKQTFSKYALHVMFMTI
jgi:hypothetical protein